MVRSKVKVIKQSSDVNCGPTSLKHALEIIGVRKSVSSLEQLCKTNRNGTTTKQMIRAIRSLGYSAMAVSRCNLRHITSALTYTSDKPRAAIVDYLYGGDEEVTEIDSGHWAAVSSYSHTKKRLTVMDSYSGKRKSYSWQVFKSMWRDFDRVRKPISKFSKRYRIARKWQNRLLLIIAKHQDDLPKFRLNSLVS